MKPKDFNAKVAKIIATAKEIEKQNPVENLAEDYTTYGGKGGVFQYAGVMEYNFELNLRKDYERKTTFTADFSIAEWCVRVQGMSAVWNTLRNALTSWREDIEYFAELIIVLNMKSWEHDARNNSAWCMLYSELYYMVKDLYFDWFEHHPKSDEAFRYYFKNVD